MLPIIDLKSSDESCIYSTLSYVKHQATLVNIPNPCITFDQLLWWKGYSELRDNFCEMVGNFLNEKLEQSDVNEINELYEKLRAREISSIEISNYPALVKIQRALDTLMHELRDRSRTAKLWLAYIEYVDTLKLFIRAERTGDWNLHLVAVGKMLKLFAATGHFNYAKSARLYSQLMLELP